MPRPCRWFACGLTFTLFASSAAAQVPQLLGYQGRLLRSDGTAATGTAAVTFGIFGSDTGGTPLWQETQTLGLSDGYYATFLGLVTAPAADLFDGGARWLEVRVGSEILNPRQPIGAVAYAHTAQSIVGGTANVASLQVGGATVVDANGRLAGSARYTGGEGVAIDPVDQIVSLAPCGTGQVLQHDGTSWRCSTPTGGTVTSVAAVAPLAVSNGSTTPLVSMPQAGTSSSGYLSSVDWASFNGKYGSLTQCGGDLSGTLAAPVVARLQSRPVSASAPATGQVLKWNGTVWEPAADENSGGTVTSVKAVSPLAVWNGSSTPEISMVAASGTADGYLATSDWLRFNAKFEAATQCGGDLVGTLASPLVAKLQGVAVSSTTPAASQVLRFDGTRWMPASLGISDVGGLSSGYVDLSTDQAISGAKSFAAAPTFGSPLGVASGGIGTNMASAGAVFAGPAGASGTPAFRALVATDLPDIDASRIASGTLGVARGGIGTATATANTVFAGPSDTSGAPAFRALVSGDVPDLDVSKLASGTLSVARGGTGVSVPFASGDLLLGATGSLARTSTGLHWDDSPAKLNVGGALAATGAASVGGLTVDGAASVSGNALISGRIGIGTSAPAVALDVAGDVRATGVFAGNGSLLTSVDALTLAGSTVADLQKLPFGVLPVLNAPPWPAPVGQAYIHLPTKTLRYYTGAEWIELGAGSTLTCRGQTRYSEWSNSTCYWDGSLFPVCDGTAHADPVTSFQAADRARCKQPQSGTCQGSTAPAWTNVPSGSDPYNECFTDCRPFAWGMDTATTCKAYASASFAGTNCDGSAVCMTGAPACTGDTAGTTISSCGSSACVRPSACPQGAAASSWDSTAELCYLDWTQHGCASGQVCNASGACETLRPWVLNYRVGFGAYDDDRTGGGSWANLNNRSLAFTKRMDTSRLKLSWQDTLGAQGTSYGNCRWRFVVDGSDIGYFSAADDYDTDGWEMENSLHQMVVENLAAGSHTWQIQVIRDSGSSCLTGWNNTGHYMMVEEIPPGKGILAYKGGFSDDRLANTSWSTYGADRQLTFQTQSGGPYVLVTYTDTLGDNTSSGYDICHWRLRSDTSTFTDFSTADDQNNSQWQMEHASVISLLSSVTPTQHNIDVQVIRYGGSSCLAGWNTGGQATSLLVEEAGTARVLAYRTGMADDRTGDGTWRAYSDRHLSFTKASSTSLLRVTYTDTLGRYAGGYDNCRWGLAVDGTRYGVFSAADDQTNGAWEMNHASHTVLVENLAAGAHTADVHVQRSGGSSCLAGWNQSGNLFMVEELVP